MSNFGSLIVKLTTAAVFAVLFSALSASVSAQAFSEGFDDITTLAARGWVQTNNSSPIGTTGWFQGNPSVFAAQSGTTTSYIGANFNSAAGTGTISNWLIAPNVVFRNGDMFTFYTRKSDPDSFPDRLQVRLSTNGASTNVGATANDVGDFTTLLLDINPTLVTGVYPTVWTQYTITISGLAGNTSGRIAFRYFVTNGGPSGANSDYIGIDTVNYTLAPTAAGFNVSGRVLNQSGSGVARATIHLTDANGNVKTATTNQFGFYQIEDIETAGTAIVTVSSKQYQFQTQVVNINDNLSEINFTAQ